MLQKWVKIHTLFPYNVFINMILILTRKISYLSQVFNFEERRALAFDLMNILGDTRIIVLK